MDSGSPRHSPVAWIGRHRPRCSTRTACTPFEGSSGDGYGNSRPAPVFELVSKLFFNEVLEHVVLMRQLGVHLLELREFSLQLLQTLELVALHAGILASTSVEGRLADSAHVTSQQPCGLCQTPTGCQGFVFR